MSKVLGIIISILFIFISVAIQVAHFIKPKENKNLNTVSTYSSKGYRVFVSIFALSMLVFYILAIISFINNNFDNGWMLVIMGFIFSIVSNAWLLIDSFSVDIIDDKTITIKRLFKDDVTFDISQIRYISSKYRSNMMFLDKDKNKLFSISQEKGGVDAFIKHIKNSGYLLATIFNEEKEVNIKAAKDYYSDSDIAIFTEIGEEYRASFENRVKKTKSKTLAIGLLICIIIIALRFISWLFIIFILFVPIPLMIYYYVLIDKYKSELTKSNLELGFNNYQKDSRVVGSSKIKYKKNSNSILVVMVLCLIMSLIGLAVISTKMDHSYDEMIEVRGTLKYQYENNGKHAFYCIAINESENEYRLSSIYLQYLNKDIKKNVSEGDEIILYIEDDYHEGSYRGKPVNVAYFYYLEANGVVYFGYDDLVNGWKDNHDVGVLMTKICLSILVGSIIIMLTNYRKYKRNKEKETIIVGGKE